MLLIKCQFSLQRNSVERKERIPYAGVGILSGKLSSVSVARSVSMVVKPI